MRMHPAVGPLTVKSISEISTTPESPLVPTWTMIWGSASFSKSAGQISHLWLSMIFETFKILGKCTVQFEGASGQAE